MSEFKQETIRVKRLIDEIAAHPEVFGGLKEKEVDTAICAYQANSLESLSHSITRLCNILDMFLKDLRRKDPGYFQEGKEGDGI